MYHPRQTEAKKNLYNTIIHPLKVYLSVSEVEQLKVSDLIIDNLQCLHGKLTNQKYASSVLTFFS